MNLISMSVFFFPAVEFLIPLFFFHKFSKMITIFIVKVICFIEIKDCL